MTKYRNHKHPMEVLRSPQYTQHVMAMTAEKLHDKGDIAEELAARDIAIARAHEAIAALVKFHQADGATLPRECWDGDFRRAVEDAEALMGHNDLLGDALTTENK